MCRSPHGVLVDLREHLLDLLAAPVEAVTSRLTGLKRSPNVLTWVSTRPGRRAPRPGSRGGGTRPVPDGTPTTAARGRAAPEVARSRSLHEQALAELVLDRRVAAVPDPALVERARGHGRVRPKRSQTRRRRDHAVLMEAVPPVRAAVVGAAHAAHLVPAPLRRQPGGGVDRMVVADHADHRIRVDGLRLVQRDTELVGRREATGGDSCGRSRSSCRPARRADGSSSSPTRAASREQPLVGVQHRLVLLVRDGAEHLGFRAGHVGQHRQRLVGVGGEDDLVEALGLAARRRDLDASRPSARSSAPGWRDAGAPRSGRVIAST